MSSANVCFINASARARYGAEGIRLVDRLHSSFREQLLSLFEKAFMGTKCPSGPLVKLAVMPVGRP